MIYTIIGTNFVKREKATEFIAKIGEPTLHIYSEQIAALLPLISASSLFGEKVIVNLIQVMDIASSREELIKLLSEMKDSQNIFIIDEPFADANRLKKLEKYSEKVFDAREEKESDVDVFTLCNLFARRDKKGAWVEWMKIRNLCNSEAIQGALWWKLKTIWEDTLNGKPTKFNRDECEFFSSKLVRASILAHRGDRDLKNEIESIILSL